MKRSKWTSLSLLFLLIFIGQHILNFFLFLVRVLILKQSQSNALYQIFTDCIFHLFYNHDAYENSTTSGEYKIMEMNEKLVLCYKLPLIIKQ